MGLLPGFKQNQQLFRSGEGCDEGSADGDSGDVDVASDDGDVVALTPQEVEKTKKKHQGLDPVGRGTHATTSSSAGSVSMCLEKA